MFDYARSHKPAALGLGIALLSVLWFLLLQSLMQVAGGTAAPGLRLAVLGGAPGSRQRRSPPLTEDFSQCGNQRLALRIVTNGDAQMLVDTRQFEVANDDLALA